MASQRVLWKPSFQYLPQEHQQKHYRYAHHCHGSLIPDKSVGACVRNINSKKKIPDKMMAPVGNQLGVAQGSPKQECGCYLRLPMVSTSERAFRDVLIWRRLTLMGQSVKYAVKLTTNERGMRYLRRAVSPTTKLKGMRYLF